MAGAYISHPPLGRPVHGLPPQPTHYTAGPLSRDDNSKKLYRPRLFLGEDVCKDIDPSQFNGAVWEEEDGLRLHQLSKIPSSALHIRSVKFNLTRADRYMVQRASSEIKDPEKHAETRVLFMSTQGETRDSFHFPRKLVAAALRDLPNLESVTLTWVECPWAKHMVVGGSSFEEASLARAGNEVFKTQQNIIEALRERNLPLKSLTLEPFMPRCVLALSSFDPAVSTVFGSVTKLRLKLDYGVSVFRPDYLNYFISLMPNIHHLSIHAWSVKDEASGIDFFITKRLRYLESIDFSCLKLKYGTLANFFSDHGSTIKQANLDNLFLWREPAGKIDLGWDDMFLVMKDRLTSLDRIRISGTFTDDAGQHQVFLRCNDSGVHSHEKCYSSEMEESAPLESYIPADAESVTYPRPHHRDTNNRTWALPTPPPESY